MNELLLLILAAFKYHADEWYDTLLHYAVIIKGLTLYTYTYMGWFHILQVQPVSALRHSHVVYSPLVWYYMDYVCLNIYTYSSGHS